MRDIEEMNLTIDDLHTLLYLLPDLNTRRLTRYLGRLKDRNEPLTTEYVLNLGKSVSESKTERVGVMKISKRKIKESIQKRLNELHTTYLHPFKHTDWDAYGGASKLPDGSDPLIHEEGNFTVLVSGAEDGDGCVLTILDNNTGEEFYDDYPGGIDKTVKLANRFIAYMIDMSPEEVSTYLQNESGLDTL